MNYFDPIPTEYVMNDADDLGIDCATSPKAKGEFSTKGICLQATTLARQNLAQFGRIRNPRATRKTGITAHRDMPEREYYRWSEPSRSLIWAVVG
jgi:hypothetical protein